MKKNQILKCLINCHANNYAAEKLDYRNDEHENKQEHVVYIVDIMFNKIDSDDCSASVVKKWCEKLMWQNENQVCEIKQLKVTWVNVDDVDDTEDSDQWEL